MIDSTIGHYKILEKLGEGGMGVVYKAIDTTLDRLVALKFLPPHVTVSEETKARFLQEARAAATLNHPNICTIFGVGEHDGHFFIAMELIEGGTLREAIANRNMSIEQMTKLGIQIGEALQEAHSRDIVHRDVKSENIMLTAKGQTKVMDFGLAKLKGSLKLTKTSSTVGTLGYMAPEQIQGGEVDFRSDIFSFGVLLFEMLTGKLPFRGEHEAAMVYSIVNEEPARIEQMIPSISPIIVNLIQRCLEKHPDERCQSMQDAVIELRRSLKQSSRVYHASASQSSPGSLPPSGTQALYSSAGFAPERQEGTAQRRVPWKLLAGVAGVLVLTIAGFVLFWTDGGRISYNMSEMELVSLPAEGEVRSLGLSPDGQYVVYIPEQSGTRSIRARHLASGSIVEVLPPTQDEVFTIEFAGSSTHFYFLTKDRRNPVLIVLNMMPVLGGPVRMLRTLEDLDDYAVSPDGLRLAYTRTFTETGEFSLMVSDIDGTNERVLATDKGPRWYHSRPAWSPDGIVILCPWGTTIGTWKHTVKVVDVSTGASTDIVEQAWKSVEGVRWLPDGKGFFLLGNETQTGNSQIWEVSYPAGNVKRFTNDLNNYGEIEVAGDGSLLSSLTYNVTFTISTLSSRDMKTTSTLTSSTQDGRDGIDWMPDGQIVYTSVTDNASKVWLMNPDGRKKKQLTFGTFSDFDITAARDGQDIVFASDRSGQINIWRIRSDGANVQKVSSGNEHYTPSFSPDKAWVYFSSWDLGPLHVMRMPADGGDAHQLSERPGGTPELSPDGESIMYMGMSADSIFIIPASGGAPLLSFPTLARRSHFQWRPESTSITFYQSEQSKRELWEAYLDGRPPRRLLDFGIKQLQRYRWSRDGQHLALVLYDVSTNIVLFKKREKDNR